MLRNETFFLDFNPRCLRINNEFNLFLQMITLGGDAELELVDSLDPFTEGIVFSVRPPKKSWKNISNLSGGEKTLSSLALVFALHYYKPTPLYVMDEIDAARKLVRRHTRALLDAKAPEVLTQEAITGIREELRQGAQEYKSILDIYSQALQRLGIEVEISLVDGAQYAERIRALDFDMTPYRRDLSLSPGNEQKLYWSSEMANVDGTRNLMGVKSAALDGLIEGLVHAKSHDDVQTITRAMDRVLMAGRYVIPIYHDGVSRIAHKANLKYPDHLPLYGDRIGFLPDVWWVEK